MSKQKIYKAAVIGCGYIGADESRFDNKVQPATHAGAYEKNDRTDLVALVDTDKTRLVAASKYFPKARLYSDICKMLEEERPDIVSVASPTDKHYEHVMILAENKVPVILCEKPISDNTATGIKMVKACAINGSQLFVGYQRRFDPIIIRWHKKLRDGLLGRLYQGNAYYYNGFVNNAGHMLDLLNMFLGLPIAISGRFNKETETHDKGQNVDGLLWYKDNMLVTLQSLSKNYGYFTLNLFGENGMVSITKGTSPIVEFRAKIKNKEAKNYFELSEKVIIDGKPRSARVPVVEHLVDFLDDKASPISTGNDGLEVLKVIDATIASANKNGRIVVLRR